jgi:hypothetical protein
MCREPRAPRQTAVFRALMICMSLLAIGVVTQTDGFTDGLGRPVLLALVWLISIARSRRVRAVYGEMNAPKDAP